MIRSTRSRKALTATAALALTFTMAACGAGNEGNGSSSGGDGDSAAVAGAIKGAGASTQEKAQAEWASKFSETNPDATVEYSPDGSGTGREKFINGAVQFAGSDAAMDEEELASAKEGGCTAETIQFPIYVAPIAVAYNLEGVDDLNLSADTIAKIFDQKIKKWDDPAIKKENPDADLPSTAITPVNRSDESGTTENFTAYLTEAAGDSWSHGPVETWPVKGGEAAKGTSGVVSTIESGDGTIGYADAAQIGELSAAKIKVGEEFVEYTPAAAADALSGAERAVPDSKTDYSVKLDRGKVKDGAYPIVLVSYAIACSKYDDAEVANTVKAYLEYAASTEGQEDASAAAGNAPLTGEALENAKAAIGNIATD